MIEFIAGIMMGFAGAFHCVGMCGPLLAVASVANLRSSISMKVVLYHTARISIYAIVALLLFIVKDLLIMDRITNTLTVVAGVTMIISALLQVAYHRSILPRKVARLISSALVMLSSHVRTKKGVTVTAALGAINGLLPCGLTMSVFIASMTLPHAWQVLLFIYGFGIGTMPGLLGLMFLGSKIGSHQRTQIGRMAPLLIVVAGTLVLLRGLSIGVPYLSPQVQHAIMHGNGHCCAGR